MKFILWFSQWAAKWPEGSFNAAAPSAGVCAFYYAAIFMIVTGWIFRSRRRWLFSGAMLAAGLFLAVQWAVARQTAHIDVLPLKGAPVFFADSAGGQGNLLVGCSDAVPPPKPSNHSCARKESIGCPRFVWRWGACRTSEAPR